MLCRPVDRESLILVEFIFPGRDLGQAGIQDNVRGGVSDPWGHEDGDEKHGRPNRGESFRGLLLSGGCAGRAGAEWTA